MPHLSAVILRDLGAGLHNRAMQAFAVLCVLGGVVLVLMSPEPEALPLLLLQALMYFGSLFGLLIGWSTAEQTRAEGAFLFAQPIGAGALLLGKLAGTGALVIALLGLLVLPGGVAAGLSGTLGWIFVSASLYLMVFLLAGLWVGFAVGERAAGLFVAMMVWALVVVGWSVLLLLLSGVGWMQGWPWLWVLLLLANPVEALRISTLFAMEMIPIEAGGELAAMGWVFEYIRTVAAGVFLLWCGLLLGGGLICLRRQTF